MGGSGAAKWGFKYPELFGTVSILAGALHTREQMQQKNDRMAETYGSAERFEQSNPWTLVEKNLEKIRGRTAIRIAVGGRDGLLAANTKFHELLDRLGLPHEFHVVPDAPHSPNPVYDGLGEKSWNFYRAALARENIGAPAKRTLESLNSETRCEQVKFCDGPKCYL